LKVIISIGFLFAGKIGIEIAKEDYCYKNTDKSGNFATKYQTE
jgi:hypothetical protein